MSTFMGVGSHTDHKPLKTFLGLKTGVPSLAAASA